VTLAEVILARADAIEGFFWETARRSASGLRLDRARLVENLREHLRALAQLDGRPHELPRELVARHVHARFRLGYELGDLVQEYFLLERCIYQAWAQHSGNTGWPPHAEAERVHAAISAAAALALGVETEQRELFVETLAHDLRGPLTVAVASATLLSQRLLGHEAHYLTARVIDAVHRADRMLRDLLDVARVRAGQKLPLTLGDCDLSALVFQLVEELMVLHGPRFALSVEHGVRGVWCAKELRRAIWNLISNGLKYGAPARPIGIGVERDGDGARVWVRNDGEPIAGDKLRDLFEPFHRGVGQSDGGGWGLGLTLVRACVDAHGGRVEVRSDGTGTEFVIRLPADSRLHYFAQDNAVG
jgi:signal transduction histidine kinase